jgi:hypothetical protein
LCCPFNKLFPNFPFRHRLTVFFTPPIAHCIQNPLGKKGMAVANGSNFYCMWKRRRSRIVLLNYHGKSLTIFIITSPSDGLFCLTDSSFYAEWNGEDRDGGCQWLQFLLYVKTASVSKFLIELECPVRCDFPITSPSDSLFCFTGISFYAESNEKDRDGGCQRPLCLLHDWSWKCKYGWWLLLPCVVGNFFVSTLSNPLPYLIGSSIDQQLSGIRGDVGFTGLVFTFMWWIRKM